MTYHHPREFLPTGKEAFVIGAAGEWGHGSFRKPIHEVRDGGHYATSYAVVLGGNFGAFELWDAAREVASWDGATESTYIKKMD